MGKEVLFKRYPKIENDVHMIPAQRLKKIDFGLLADCISKSSYLRRNYYKLSDFIKRYVKIVHGHFSDDPTDATDLI